MRVTKDQIADWTHTPVTLKQIEVLTKEKNVLMQYLSEGGCLYKEHGIQEYGRIVGRLELIEEILSLKIFDEVENYDEA